MPTMRRSCISTVSCLGLVGRAPSHLTPQSSSLLPWHNPYPHPSGRGGPSSHPISFSAFPVKVPTRRTFVDPQSCGDPLQAVHLFAKELDANSVTLEKSLGTGKLGTREAWSVAKPPLHPLLILPRSSSSTPPRLYPVSPPPPKSRPHFWRPHLHVICPPPTRVQERRWQRSQ